MQNGKQMKTVAWMSPDGKFSTTEGNLFHIPLYTAPRELSDEEILNSWEGIDPSEECWISEEQLKQFAKAILKKASEK